MFRIYRSIFRSSAKFTNCVPVFILSIRVVGFYVVSRNKYLNCTTSLRYTPHLGISTKNKLLVLTYQFNIIQYTQLRELEELKTYKIKITTKCYKYKYNEVQKICL
jgi:hypothetical protein